MPTLFETHSSIASTLISILALAVLISHCSSEKPEKNPPRAESPKAMCEEFVKTPDLDLPAVSSHHELEKHLVIVITASSVIVQGKKYIDLNEDGLVPDEQLFEAQVDRPVVPSILQRLQKSAEKLRVILPDTPQSDHGVNLCVDKGAKLPTIMAVLRTAQAAGFGKHYFCVLMESGPEAECPRTYGSFPVSIPSDLSVDDPRPWTEIFRVN